MAHSFISNRIAKYSWIWSWITSQQITVITEFIMGNESSECWLYETSMKKIFKYLLKSSIIVFKNVWIYFVFVVFFNLFHHSSKHDEMNCRKSNLLFYRWSNKLWDMFKTVFIAVFVWLTYGVIKKNWWSVLTHELRLKVFHKYTNNIVVIIRCCEVTSWCFGSVM